MSNYQQGLIDAGWMLLATKNTPMHLGCLLIFKTASKSTAQNGEIPHAQDEWEGCELRPPWNCRIRESLTRKVAPSLEVCPNTTLDNHFYRIALPQPGGERELGMAVSRLHSNPLDHSAPPWECYALEGLYDDRFAIYLKLHPVLAIKLGGLDFLDRWLGSRSNQGSAPPPWSIPSVAPKNPSSNFSLDHFIKRQQSTFQSVAKGCRSLAKAAITDRKRLTVPYTAPKSVLNSTIGSQRRIATQQYPISTLSKVAKRHNVDITAVILFMLGSALRRFLMEYNALPGDPLLASIPLALGEGHEDKALAEALSPVTVSLGSEHAAPDRRLNAIKLSLAAAQHQINSLPEDARAPYSIALAAPFITGQLTGTSRWLPILSNLNVTTLQGPKTKRYLGQYELDALYPMIPLMQNIALSIGCIRYHNTLNIGFTGARETLPKLQRIAVYTGEALGTLKTLEPLSHKASNEQKGENE